LPPDRFVLLYTNLSANYLTHTAPTGLSGQEGLKFRLTVSDGRGGSSSDDVWITVVVRPPTAHAGLNRTVAFGSRVTLDGSGSSDPDAGDRLTYQWEQIHTQSVTLNNAASARASFTSPSGHADLVFKLTVTDLAGHRHSDEVTVRVRDFNRAPTAYAGADRAVSAGETVTLFGSGRDPDGDTLEYAWTQRSGTPVGLTNSTTSRLSFTAPDDGATLVFRLTVTDPGGLSDTDDATITVRAVNRPPNADAGPDATYSTASRGILLRGRGTDPDGDSLKYRWEHIGGQAVNLTDADKATARFTDMGENFTSTFRLTVTDEHGASDSDEVTITIRGN
ncbi:MAG: PKD domain-containing protein, partial [Chloroflexi bacterium]|nr:PKD domain-containing protein [Chloroflexota bacterium]